MPGTARSLAILALVAHSPSVATAEQPELRLVSYRGGVVEFRIPAHWSAEYGEDGGGAFWDAEGGAGTLRLDVLTFEKTGEIPDKPALAVLKSSKHSGEIREIGEGNAIREYSQRSTEDGDEITLYFWEVANFVPPTHFRLAIFSYTILASQENSPETRAELALIREQVAAARFSSTLGVVP